jgi:hypothetical protein
LKYISLVIIDQFSIDHSETNKMSSPPPYETKYLYRQGSITSLPDEDDQMTAVSDSSIIQQRQLGQSNEYSKVPSLDDRHSFHDEKEYQTSTIDLQTIPDEDNPDTNVDHSFRSWRELVDEISTNDYRYKSPSQSDTTDDVTTSFGFQLQEQTENNHQTSPVEIDLETDYETFLRSKQLYYDPNPELIRKPQMITPIIYRQNIKIKFLKPPSVPQGPLIIREVRPPPPPLVSIKLILFLINLDFEIGYPTTSSTSSFTTTNYSSGETSTSACYHVRYAIS